MKKMSTIEGTEVLTKSKYFDLKPIMTEIPLLNIAFSGELDGGLTGGITMLAGESKTFKTGFLIQLVKSFQTKHPNGVCVFYDSEFSPLDYWKRAGINMDLVLHTPITTVEQLKHDFAKQLDEISDDEKVMFVCDSIGGLASRKEAEDAVNRADMPVDMTRAKSINSLFRIITPQLNKLKIDFVLINSFYETMDMYPKRVYAGGKKVFLSCDDVFFISRSKQKDGKDLIGYNFILTADKSRTIIEGSKFPISVTYADGINRYSGLYELAKEAGLISVAGAWIKIVDFDTGELSNNIRAKDITDEYYESLLTYEPFKAFLRSKYQLSE